MRKCLMIGLTLGLLLGNSQVKPASFSLDKPTSIRIIGLAAALGGIYALAHKHVSAFTSLISSFGGATLLVGGLLAVLGADRLCEEFDRHVAKDGFLDKLGRNINHLNNEMNK